MWVWILQIPEIHCSTHQPLPSHHLQYSGSSDTDDFIREVAERHNISYSLLNKVHSEDEISNPFSLSSSHHSLLIVESDLEKDGSCSPEDLDSPAHTKEKEPRNSYSLSSCAVTLSPPVGNGFTMASERETEYFVRSGVNLDKETTDHNTALRPLHIFKRQGALLESTEDTELNRLTPTNLMSNCEGISLSITPTPQMDVKTDGEVSPGQSRPDRCVVFVSYTRLAVNSTFYCLQVHVQPLSWSHPFDVQLYVNCFECCERM